MTNTRFSNNNLSNSRKIVQVTTDDHGFSLGYDADNGLYTLVDLTRFYLASKDDLKAVKSKQINRYTSAEKNTDTVLSSYENKDENFILQFASNDTTGTIPTLTGSHLFIIEHFMVGDNSNSAIERAYSTKGKLIAWRFKQWWNNTWSPWENS